MSKCGKGCMPECQYFTTGGCISPFNCSYKIEQISLTTAKSSGLNSNEGYMSETYKDKEISRLKAENAELRATLSKMETVEKELRARLDKAVELPCVKLVKTKEWINREKLGEILYEWTVIYIDKEGYFVVEPCASKYAAEARLAELKGGRE